MAGNQGSLMAAAGLGPVPKGHKQSRLEPAAGPRPVLGTFATSYPSSYPVERAQTHALLGGWLPALMDGMAVRTDSARELNEST